MNKNVNISHRVIPRINAENEVIVRYATSISSQNIIIVILARKKADDIIIITTTNTNV